MPFIDLGDGSWAHINLGRSRSKRCRFCGQQYREGALCDFPVGGSKTCDAAMCRRCTTSVGPDLDHCPDHKHQQPTQGVLAL